MGRLGNCVGRKRVAAGIRQQDLAARVGVSRQSLSVLEKGRSVPSAALALRLAHVLGCPVEELFWLESARAFVTAQLAADDHQLGPGVGPARTRARAQANEQARVTLATIDGRWVAHRLPGDDAASVMTAADGVLSGSDQAGPDRNGDVRVALLDDPEALRDTVLCAGCAPTFAMLAARVSAQSGGARVRWLERSSGAALDLLARGQIHVAGAHLYDEGTDLFNVPFVERRFPGRAMLLYNLARWETGLAVAPGNPRRIRGTRDLGRDDIIFVRRQAGAAARDLLDRLSKSQGVAPREQARVARSHWEAAHHVALGLADAGVTLPSLARAHGLDFVPLTEERFDLILSKDLVRDARIARLLETLSGRAFRREMQSLGGHVTRSTGKLIADTGATP